MTNPLISLFEYLGHAAGSDLGKQVAEYGGIRKTSFGRKSVKTKKYQGEVITYKREFLDEFFKVKALFEGVPKEELEEINNQLIAESYQAVTEETPF